MCFFAVYVKKYVTFPYLVIVAINVFAILAYKILLPVQNLVVFVKMELIILQQL